MRQDVNVERHLSAAFTGKKSLINIALIKIVLTLFTILVGVRIGHAEGGEINVGVAANFTATFKQLELEFEQLSGHQLAPSFGSTGQLYAQIHHGAPFDLFLSADVNRADKLIQEHQAEGNSGFIYAQGKLVLLSTTGMPVADGVIFSLPPKNNWRLAIANPKLAPYGLAAVETLQALGAYAQLKDHMIVAQSIAQTMQFVASGHVDLGFVALSQVRAISSIDSNQYWLVPTEMYRPINQKAVLLNKGRGNIAAKEFLTFLRSDKAISIIHSHGYSTVPMPNQPHTDNVLSTDNTPWQP